MILPTYTVTLWIAGDIDTARRVVRERAYNLGMCVTVTPTTFIYTGGEESGVAIGFVNYPRFPSTPAAIRAQAREIAETLIAALNQKSALLVATDVTEWISVTPPGAPRKAA
mgnify:CR=1 FL=1